MTARYQDGYRRILVDMHIPDGDDKFLAGYDPIRMAELAERAGASGVMVYCKSHVGLSYWPTTVGLIHRAARTRDLVGEQLDALRARGIGVCAYQSVVFDNAASEAHPDWRQRTVTGDDARDRIRYGLCCLNNPDYRDYEVALLQELLGRYEFDAVFVDMIFWRLVCACRVCAARYAEEAGAAIPSTIDWTAPEWCRFQAARERWTAELTTDLFDAARKVSPTIAVTHNLAPALGNWHSGQPLWASALDSFVAGDMYGDATEQLVVSKAILHLGQERPAEFMTTRTVDLFDHVRTKSRDAMLAQAMAAVATSSAFLFIDAIDPVGTANAAVYDQIAAVFGAIAPYEAFMGGEPVEEIAVYLSGESQMDFADSGTPLAAVQGGGRGYPHLESVRGACRALQRAHLPFGVITDAMLGALSRYRVVVLPNVSRMRQDEVVALREYVRAGGALYASRYTSLVDASGVESEDFMLADLFGAHYAGEESGRLVYSRPADDLVATASSPQSHLSHLVGDGPHLCRIPRLRRGEGRALATLEVPYGYPLPGTVTDGQWSSIHSSPPWAAIDAPTIVTNTVGRGSVVYSAADIERVGGAAEEAVFVALLGSMLGADSAFSVEAHPSVWVSAFDQRDRGRIVLSLLAYPGDLPPLPSNARFTLRSPDGARFTSVVSAPDGRAIVHEADVDGRIRAAVRVDPMAVVVANYEPASA